MNAPKNLLCRAAPFHLRSDPAGDGFTLEGYGAVFDTPTRIDSWEGLFDEKIARGAFAKTISERKPVLQFDHGRDLATGSVPIGAIEELREDRKGLFVRARLHDNARVEPIRQAIASGAIDGMSFRFQVLEEKWNESGPVPLRTITEVELFELGPVVFPAYEATTVGVRTLLAGLSPADRDRLVDELTGSGAVNSRRLLMTSDRGRYLTPKERREVLYPFLASIKGVPATKTAQQRRAARGAVLRDIKAKSLLARIDALRRVESDRKIRHAEANFPARYQVRLTTPEEWSPCRTDAERQAADRAYLISTFGRR